jgi:hypothetical protein
MVCNPPFRSRNGRKCDPSINLSGDKGLCILGVG